MVKHFDVPVRSVNDETADGLQDARIALVAEFADLSARVQQPSPPADIRRQSGKEQNDHLADLTRESPDAARVVNTKDGASIYFDANDRVTHVRNVDNDWRDITYDSDGKIASVKAYDQTLLVQNGDLVYPDGRLTGMRNPTISADGTYSYTFENRTISIHTDRTRTTTREDGSTVSSDRNDFICEIKYPDGRARSFTYGDSSALINSFTDVDGKRYDYDPNDKSPGRTFRAADGTTIRNLSVKFDGTVEYQNKDTTLSVDYTNGDFTRTTKTAFDFIYAAYVLRPDNRANQDDTFVKNTLQKMTPADRVALAAEYWNQHRRLLSDQLKLDMQDPQKRVNAEAALLLLPDKKQ